MKRVFSIIHAILLSIFVPMGQCAAGQASNNEAGNIVVTVVKINDAEGGNLIVSLYNVKDTWLKTDEALISEILTVTGDSMVVEFASMPYDSMYAVAVIHDKNMNGKLDMRRFPWPKPKEGAGVSNNDFGFGPPDYEDAQLNLDIPVLDVRIELRY
jgi:uncharacterized protein (DUF2141 family)